MALSCKDDVKTMRKDDVLCWANAIETHINKEYNNKQARIKP